MSNKEQLRREFTDEELRRLVNYFSLLIEMDQHQKAVEQAGGGSTRCMLAEVFLPYKSNHSTRSA